MHANIVIYLFKVIGESAPLAHSSSGIYTEFDCEQSWDESEIKKQKQRINRLQIELDHLLQSFYNRIIDPRLLKMEQKRLTREITLAKTVMAEAKNRLHVIYDRRDRAIWLATSLNFRKAFTEANSIIKRYFCQAFFSSIAVDDRLEVADRSKEYWWIKDHHVSITFKRNHPIDIQQIVNAILALSL